MPRAFISPDDEAIRNKHNVALAVGAAVLAVGALAVITDMGAVIVTKDASSTVLVPTASDRRIRSGSRQPVPPNSRPIDGSAVL